MIGKISQSKLAPTIQGVMGQASTYGATIPRYYGTTFGSPLLTWLNGIRQASSSKKGTKKSGGSTYNACASLLIGHNPIQHVLRVIASQIGLGLTSQKTSTSYGGASFTITDPDFYALMGVTVTVPYSFTFTDYGAPSGFTESGNWELPLWNLAMQGPDPTNPSGYKNEPWTYYCLPGSTNVTQLPSLSGPTALNIYYAATVASGFGAGKFPLPYILNLIFESSLGDGPEYTGYKDFTAQRIIYPMFAGAGSYNFDIGAGAAPQMRIEVQGAYTLYPDPVASSVEPRADADFADMVEDILRMGQTQAAMTSSGVGTATARSPMQMGTSCWEFPGTVQKKFWAQTVHGNFSGSMQFDLPITKGNVLVAAVGSNGGSHITLSDTLGNSWTAVVGANGVEFFYAIANASGNTTLTFTNAPTNSDLQIFEIGGCDSVDAVVLSSASGSSFPTGTIATTSTPGQTGYVLAWVFAGFGAGTGTGVAPRWKTLIPSAGQGGNFYGKGPQWSFSEYRQARYPGTFTFTGDQASSTWVVVMLALKNAVAPSYPRPFGNIIDQPSLDQVRMQCRANGLWGSLCMNSQKKASDWLADLYECMNADPVWSGFRLKSIPRSEVSKAGNGAFYSAATTLGPIVNLTSEAGDFIGDSGSPLIDIERTAVLDRQPLLRLQFPDANNNYNTATVSQPDPLGLTLYGLRQASPKVFSMVQHVSVARMLLGIMVRRQNYLLNNYKFKLKAKYKLLEAGDLVTLTDTELGLTQVPVRFTSITENPDYSLDCEAEDFLYGLHDPTPLPTTESQSNPTGTTTAPAAVNTPIFLEPPLALTGDTQDQLWIAVSDSDPAYGGCQVYVSVDGGTSYTALEGIDGSSLIMGNAVTGVTTADWPQALDPDTTNNLAVDLTESLGVLQQYSVAQEDNFSFPCYVAGSGIFPFELMSYAVATLTAANKYTLQATGGGNKLRRGLFGTWVSTSNPNTGSDHPNGSRFAFLDPTGTGIFKVRVPSVWTGKTLFFKFVQFNGFGSGQGTLAAATAYSYTVIGTGNTGGQGGGTGGSGGGGSSSYTISPANPLSNPTSTSIAMAGVIATFSPSNLQTLYNARTFSIPTPTAATAYYVTVYDPSLTGDTGSGTTLTAFCTTSQAASFVGQPGYIYMGSILAQPTGGGSQNQGGGSNPGSGASLNFADAVSATPAPDGTTTTFTLPATPNPPSSCIGELNGQRIYQGLDFTLSGTSVVMTNAPQSGDVLRFSFRF